MTSESKPFLLILIAPSGGGKSTLCQEVLRYEKDFVYSISSTTREIRGEEENGKAYFFLSEDEFLAARDRDEFIETALVHGNWYGTSRKFIKDKLDSGKNVVLDIDVQGALQILKSGIEAVTVFILPPSHQELRHRLENRGTDKAEKIELRLHNAQLEISHLDKFDYLIINDSLDDAVADLRKIICAEKLKVNRYINAEEKYYRSR